MPIKQWPERERPRERLLRLGASALSDAELLAIFLRTGLPGKTAVDLAREMISHFGSLQQIATAGQQDFCRFAGMGPAKFTQLQAVLEMSSRCLDHQLREAAQELSRPELFAQFAKMQIGLAEVEHFLVIGLNAHLKVVAHKVLATGTVNKAAVYPREVARFAIEQNASRLMVAHNHPSGNCQPSPADDRLTECLKNALGLLDIELVDHLIVSKSNSYSYRQNARLPF